MKAEMLRTPEYQRKVYPNAVWLLGDPCPIGERVRDGDKIGVILGEHVEAPRPMRHCASCACVSEPGFKGWWQMRVDGMTMGGEPLVMLVYPPSLSRAP